jgi:hypothetical protein
VYLCGVMETDFGIAEHHCSLRHALLLPSACPAAAGVASLMTTKKEKAKKEKAKKEKAKKEKAKKEKAKKEKAKKEKAKKEKEKEKG